LSINFGSPYRNISRPTPINKAGIPSPVEQVVENINIDDGLQVHQVLDIDLLADGKPKAMQVDEGRRKKRTFKEFQLEQLKAKELSRSQTGNSSSLIASAVRHAPVQSHRHSSKLDDNINRLGENYDANETTSVPPLMVDPVAKDSYDGSEKFSPMFMARANMGEHDGTGDLSQISPQALQSQSSTLPSTATPESSPVVEKVTASVSVSNTPTSSTSSLTSEVTLPEGWTVRFSNKHQREYWFNSATGKSQWFPPT
jgi:hypothetical protein